jgi:hypothetical protein
MPSKARTVVLTDKELSFLRWALRTAIESEEAYADSWAHIHDKGGDEVRSHTAKNIATARKLLVGKLSR